MIRISKLADYALQVLQVVMASDQCLSANKCAEKTRISVATVSKLLKILLEAKLLVSEKGAKGGYLLSRPPETITLADLVSAIDGPLALTECSKLAYDCPHEKFCGQQENWQTISQIIFNVLSQISLRDMARKVSAADVQVLQFLPLGQKKGN